MAADRSSSSARGVGPTALNRIFHDRSVRFGLGLAIAVAIPVAILFYFQFRSLHDLEQTSTVVLRQLSQETAETLAKNVESALKTPHIGVLLRITQGRTEPLDLPFIEPVFADALRRSPFIDTFYTWTEIDDHHAGHVLAIDRSQLAELPPPRTSPDEAAAEGAGTHFIVDPPEGEALVRQLKEFAPRKRAIVAFQTTIGGRPKHVQAQLRFRNPATRDRLTSFVAFAVDAERLRAEYFPAFIRTQVAGLRGPTGFPPLVVAILDEGGGVLVHTDGSSVDRFVDEREFPLVFFDKELLEFAAPLETHREIWRVRTGYGGQTIPQIVRATIAPQLRMMAFLAIVMSISVFLLARAAAREVRLAELKSNFVSAVSHDLKTPLALIQLFAETLELGRVKTTDRAQEYYRIINAEARKLTRLINNILDFSRIEAGLRRYRMAPVDLVELSSRVVAELDSLFRQHNFRVTVHVATPPPPVLADEEAVAQALENLLSNAMKYSPDHREVGVTVGRDEALACISVADRGVGIPRKQQRKIFRKFYRVESENGLGPQGSGLGLAIVDHIMRAHRGAVRVDSEPDRGSTFTLCFPITSEASAHEHEADPGGRGRAPDAARAS